jgi:hypothetical protein
VAPRRRDSCACMRPAATTAARSCVCASPRVTPAARTAASCLRNGARSSGRDRAASRVLLARSSCSHSRMSRPKLSVPAPMERRVRRCWRTGASWPERAAAVDLVQVRERRRGLHDLHAPGRRTARAPFSRNPADHAAALVRGPACPLNPNGRVGPRLAPRHGRESIAASSITDRLSLVQPQQVHGQLRINVAAGGCAKIATGSSGASSAPLLARRFAWRSARSPNLPSLLHHGRRVVACSHRRRNRRAIGGADCPNWVRAAPAGELNNDRHDCLPPNPRRYFDLALKRP